MSKPKEQPKVHYTDKIDPEHFKKVTAPAVFKAMEALEKIDKNKAV